MKTCLVVDDSRVIRMVARKILEELNFEVIERNGLGAIKAVSAASLALRGDGHHFVPLDACIETMRQTGQDMSDKYKETALGGLAVNVPNC